MTTHSRRWTLIAVVVLVLLLVLVIAAVLGNRSAPPDRPPQQVRATTEQVQQGRYLARAGDCAACHQTEGGGAYAGGFPLETPFGTIYGTNITSDPDHGIGRWTADEFFAAVTRGKAPHGRNLYPAMPYTAYHTMSRADSDLIYAYLMQVPPVAQANKAPEVPFPFNIRLLLSGWNLLFFDEEPLPAASEGSGAQWERGRYLTNVMGHCGECHTPRGLLGQLQRDQWLQGYAMNRYLAPDLRPEALVARGWTAPALARYLHSGMAKQGVASDEMYPVIMHSTQYLSAADLQSMTQFLLGTAAPPAEATAISAPVAADAPGHQTYLNLCAGCHGAAGEGLPNTMPALAGNATVKHEDPTNTLLAILHGVEAKDLPDGNAMAGMPTFAARLDDQAIAELTNYLRQRWGGQAANVSTSQVAELRDPD